VLTPPWWNRKLTKSKVYPGDLVTFTFTLQNGTTWKQVWSVTPGAIGTAAGATATFGTSSFTFGASLPISHFHVRNDWQICSLAASGAFFNYVSAYLLSFVEIANFKQIWLQALFTGTFWAFGNLSWSNIQITASTTDTSWCTPYVSTHHIQASINFKKISHRCRTSGSGLQCHIRRRTKCSCCGWNFKHLHSCWDDLAPASGCFGCWGCIPSRACWVCDTSVRRWKMSLLIFRDFVVATVRKRLFLFFMHFFGKGGSSNNDFVSWCWWELSI